MVSTHIGQVVLLTDGMDTRPYRLSWPTSTIIFDISPESVFKRAAQKLEGVWIWFKISKEIKFFNAVHHEYFKIPVVDISNASSSNSISLINP